MVNLAHGPSLPQLTSPMGAVDFAGPEIDHLTGNSFQINWAVLVRLPVRMVPGAFTILTYCKTFLIRPLWHICLLLILVEHCAACYFSSLKSTDIDFPHIQANLIENAWRSVQKWITRPRISWLGAVHNNGGFKLSKFSKLTDVARLITV